MKTIEDNDVTDRVGLVNAKTKTELSEPIWPSAICDENQTGPRRDGHTNVVYTKNEIKLLW